MIRLKKARYPGTATCATASVVHGSITNRPATQASVGKTRIPFTPAQVSRYTRHLILLEVGGAGQRKSSFPTGRAQGYTDDYPKHLLDLCPPSRQLEDRRQQANEVRRHTGRTAAAEPRGLARAISDMETSR